MSFLLLLSSSNFRGVVNNRTGQIWGSSQIDRLGLVSEGASRVRQNQHLKPVRIFIPHGAPFGMKRALPCDSAPILS
jgi:hypothetical protein